MAGSNEARFPRHLPQIVASRRRMMKLYINGRFLTQEITGVQRYGRAVVESIDTSDAFARSFETTLLIPRTRGCIGASYRRIAVRQVGRLAGHAWEQMELPRYCRDGLLFCPANTAPVSRLVSRAPTLVTVHSLSFRLRPDAYTWQFRYFYELLIPIVLRLSKRVITVSASEATIVSEQYPFSKGRLTVLQNGGFSEALAEKIPSIAPRRVGFPYGLYVGSLSKGKNFSRLFESAVTMARETGVGFAFVGGEQAAFRRSSLEVPADLRGKLLFVGQIDDPLDLIGWYKGALFMAFPSLYEASPFPPIEAMSCGCPVIASAIPALQERCEEAALYCDPHSTTDITSSMIRLVRDERLRAELISRGFARAAEFSWRRYAAALLQVVEQVSFLDRKNG